MKTAQTHLKSHAWLDLWHRRTRVNEALGQPDDRAETLRVAQRLAFVKTKSELPGNWEITTETMVTPEQSGGNSQSYVIFSDFLITTALDNYLAETADLLGEQAGSSIDLVVRNIITSGTNVRFVGGVGSRGAVTASSILSAAEMRRSLRALKRVNARPFPELNGNYAFLIHPERELLGRSSVRASGKVCEVGEYLVA